MSSPSPALSPPATSNATASPPPTNTTVPPLPTNTTASPPASNTKTASPPGTNTKPPPPRDTSTTAPPPATPASPPATPASPPSPTPVPPPTSTATPSVPPPSPAPPNTTTPTTPPPSPPPSSPATSPPTPSPPGKPPPPPSNHSGSPTVEISPPPPSPASSTTPSKPSNSGKLTPPATGSRSTPSSSSVSSPPSPPSSSSTISTGLVVGIAVGGVFILLVLSFLFVCCCKKKKRRYDGSSDYYVPPPPAFGCKEDLYICQPQRWQQHALPPSDHAAIMPTDPYAHWQQKAPPHSDHAVAPVPNSYPPSAVASQAPQPPLFTSSSAGSGSNNYSGSEGPTPQPPSQGMGMAFSKSTFLYEELAMATDGFSNANLLGQGGFGFVHKGVLPNGKEIAVKQLKTGSGQGEREFQAEVEIISRVHHRYLVSLVGYCITGSQRLLVYEFLPNNTLEFHLHGKGRPTMDWPTRLKIALGSAKGLAYLHEDCYPKIIHRDIKAANILLDFKFEAKVADFGLAKFTSDLNTHVSTRVMGTFGYMAPEYASSGKLTEKSDVFSFGVMLLELITGRRPVDSTNTYMDDSLVDWARPLLTQALEDGNFDAVADPRLHKVYNPDEMARMVDCAAGCVRHSARRRPRMSQIVRALEEDVSLADLNEGVKPGQSKLYSSYGSSDYDTSQYNEDMKRFRKMALTSQEYGSSEYSASAGATSEYGLNQSGSSSEYQLTSREMEMAKMRKDSRGFSRKS